MAKTCDVCGTTVPQDAKFCPLCELEIVSIDPQRTSAQSPLASHATQPPSESAEQSDQPYAFKQPAPDKDLLLEKLHSAETLYSEGSLRQCADLLRAVTEQIAGVPALRRRFDRIAQALKKNKHKAIGEAQQLLGQPDRLLQFLTGPVVQQLDQQEICRLALLSAKRCYRREAENVRQLLRMGAFRDLPNAKMRAEHKRLEDLVWRRSRRQHFLSSAVVFTVAIAIAIPALILWVLFLLALPLVLKLGIALAALCTLLWGLGPIRKWIELKVEGGSEDDDAFYED